MEYYEDAIRNLKNAKSEQVASALLINTAEKLQNGISQQWINQFLHDPDLREKGRHQVVKYLSDAATIRNDDFVVGKFMAPHVVAPNSKLTLSTPPKFTPKTDPKFRFTHTSCLLDVKFY